MSTELKIVGLVTGAWARTVANPTLPGWRSVYIMAGSVAMIIKKEIPDSLLAAAMYEISDAAKQRMTALQPSREI